MIRPILSSLYLLVQVLLGDAPERKCSREHHVKKHAEGPHIYRLPVVLVLTHDFRRHVTWRTAEDLQSLMVSNDHREAKVDDFDHPCTFLDKNIIELQISMYCINAVKERNGFGDLFKDPSSGSFANNPIRHRF